MVSSFKLTVALKKIWPGGGFLGTILGIRVAWVCRGPYGGRGVWTVRSLVSALFYGFTTG